jgi:hypothetical protein
MVHNPVNLRFAGQRAGRVAPAANVRNTRAKNNGQPGEGSS